MLAGAITSAIISIHALLTESDLPADLQIRVALDISIHALLTESDHLVHASDLGHLNFYPRSPYGERQDGKGG